MLSDFEVGATIPVADMERAKKFYAEKLGLRPKKETSAGMIYQCKNSFFFMYLTQFAGTALNTAAGWRVNQIECAVDELRSKGIEFEEYDLPGIRTVGGIATIDGEKMAWFKDSEGNILALIESGN